MRIFYAQIKEIVRETLKSNVQQLLLFESAFHLTEIFSVKSTKILNPLFPFIWTKSISFSIPH